MATEHELMRDVAYWRALLTRVADDLERAADAEADAKRKTLVRKPRDEDSAAARLRGAWAMEFRNQLAMS